MQTTTIRTFETAHFQVLIQVVETHEGSFWLQDLYTPTDTHEAGVTIQVPDHLQGRNAPKFYIGQYTPAELAKDYARQGRENPSKVAYESLQNELGHYITADDCFLQCKVYGAGHELACVTGISFEYSYEYDDESLEDLALIMLKEHGREFIHEAIKDARQELEILKEIA